MPSLPAPQDLRRVAQQARSAARQREEEERRRLEAEEQAEEDARRAASARAHELRRTIVSRALNGQKSVAFSAVPTDPLKALRTAGFTIEVVEHKRGLATGTVSWGDAYSIRQERLREFSGSCMAWISSYRGRKFFQRLAKALEAAAAHGKFELSIHIDSSTPAPSVLAEALRTLGHQAQAPTDGAAEIVVVRWGPDAGTNRKRNAGPVGNLKK